MDDEQKVRKVVSDWLAATVVGDLEKIRSLVTEDVVFLSAASTSIRGRETFIDGQRDVFKYFRIDPKVDIREVRVSGDMASCWTHLEILITACGGRCADEADWLHVNCAAKKPGGRVANLARRKPSG